MIWKAKLVKYSNEARIAVEFDKDKELIRRIKLISGARWSPQKKFWHIPDNFENRMRFKIAQKDDSLPSAEGQIHLDKFVRWLSAKRYSANTIKTYMDALRTFFVFYRSKPVLEITNTDVMDFNNDFILKEKLSASYQNQIISAIKLYFKTILETRIEIDKIERPKKSKRLPNVLSKEEIKLILEAHSNM